MSSNPASSNALTSIGYRSLCLAFILSLLALAACEKSALEAEAETKIAKQPRPNILFIMSDDQSWEHLSVAGYPLVSTPNIDRIANEGFYFERAYAAAPTCTASRSAILSGQHIWKLGSAALLHGNYPRDLLSYQDELADAGYDVGYTGKGWGPGSTEKRASGLRPAGAAFNDAKRDVSKHFGNIDLVKNFEQFLEQRDSSKPFSFWVGSVEPHRSFDLTADNRFASQESYQHIPGVLPRIARNAKVFSAYLDEIELFDNDVGALYGILEKTGLLANTIIVVTSDNGMPFTRAKTQNYEYGVRVPLMIRVPNNKNAGLSIATPVSLTDLAPTFLEMAGISPPETMTGRDLSVFFQSYEKNKEYRPFAFTAFERHGLNVRDGENNLRYPRRAIHSEHFAYIRNYFPERWPAGDPPRFSEAYPSMLIDPISQKKIEPEYSLNTQKRPMEELYDLTADPFQLNNIARKPQFHDVKRRLSDALCAEQRRTDDYILADNPDACDSNN